ncbi:MAG: NADH-quinone oxidoreductase subunit K [Thermoguttaceae bacterium]|jgi:hydrogenase-4 component E
MNALTDVILVFLILTTFWMLGSSRLASCVRICAIQGVATGLLGLVGGGTGLTLRVAAISLGMIVLKGLIFPRLILRALRESNTSHEVQPFVGYVASLLVGVLILGLSFWVDSRLPPLPHVASRLVVPVAFTLLIAGLFLIVARKTAVNQVLGYLVLESGIYIFGFGVVPEIPVLVELGVLMDVFVAVFVMGIAIYRINRTFDHIDSDQLTLLKG